MKANEQRKGKHLTREDRDLIETMLNEQYPLHEIAKKLAKDPTTVSKEIKRNRIVTSRQKHVEYINCNNRKECSRKHICNSTCNRLCKKCITFNCYRICPEYETLKCINLTHFPHVCNGCKRLTNCHIEKQHYRAKVADAKYHEELSSSREGVDITPAELHKLDKLISPLILKGQPLTHILANHATEIGCSERTLYNYLEKNMFTARNIDLLRKVKFKPRRKLSKPSSRTQTHRLGRTYEDFNAFIEANPGTAVVEMDTVHGTNSGKVMLTLFFRNCSLMIGFLMDSCSTECVDEALNNLYDCIGLETFRKTFPVILTDNGSEFKSPALIECDRNGRERTKVFYCDPMASYQKPHIEKNHEYIRYVLPKGKPFKNLVQADVTRIMNHVNSTARASLNGQTPYKLAQLLVDNSLLETLSLIEIPADEVHLKPSLLKK